MVEDLIEQTKSLNFFELIKLQEALWVRGEKIKEEAMAGALTSEERELVHKNDRIKAIHNIRKRSGLSLVEAKELLDRLASEE